jgi:hypothetical protein
MSYDLHLFKPETGVDPLETVERLFAEDADEINPGLPQPEKESRKRALADALIKLNPELEVFTFGFKEIAESEGISEAEARSKFRHLELNGPEGGNGIQITLYDDVAVITVPYWHAGEKARDTFKEIRGYLSLLEREGGFVTYDPQLEKILDLSSDLFLALEAYESVTSGL